MPRIAVMGGIGAGKTAVTSFLATRGAVIIDADEIARDVVQPGEPTWQKLRDAFGDAILCADGTLDRAFVAEVVFHDAAALRRLNFITHTAIGLAMVNQVNAVPPDQLAVVALPLYRKMHRELLGLNEVWCVWVEPALAQWRLTNLRGLSDEDARARLASQPTNAARFALADRLLQNDGTLDDLHRRVMEVMAEGGLPGA